MPGSSPLFSSSPESAAEADRPDPPEPALAFDRPSVLPPVRSRFAELCARLSVSPGRVAALGAAAVVAVVAGAWLLRSPSPAVESTLPRAGDAPSASSIAPPSTQQRPVVVVDVAGSVRRPGVYRLRPDARVDDVIRAAGGLSHGADRERLNLAAQLADGQQVYVPKEGESTPPTPVGPTGGSAATTAPGSGAPGPGQASGGTSVVPTAQIDLNSATADQLDTLPGVGPATAEAILAYRTEHGSFRSVDELLDVRGIGDAKLAALRIRVRV